MKRQKKQAEVQDLAAQGLKKADKATEKLYFSCKESNSEILQLMKSAEESQQKRFDELIQLEKVKLEL